jgi:hypothetical protein
MLLIKPTNNPDGVPGAQTCYNMKTVLREIRCGVIDWIKLAEDRDQMRDPVNTEMNLPVPENVGKFVSSWATRDFSRRTRIHGVS